MADDGPRRLDELGARIDRAQRSREAPPRQPGKFAGAELAWRMVIDLVAGVGIGFGIGYGIDSLLGSAPLFLIPFVLLGFAAGVRVMLRSAREYQRRAEEAEKAGAEGS